MCKMKRFPEDENKNAEDNHSDMPWSLYWYRYLATQIKLLFQPPIQTPPYISTMLKDTIHRAAQREQTRNEWKEIWTENARSTTKFGR